MVVLVIIIIIVWVLLTIPRNRADGELIAKIHPYRRIMPFLMRGRNESVVYYDDVVRVGPLLDLLAENEQVSLTHCLVRATTIGLAENPKMNRFISGKRLYQRKEISLTFSMKRRKMDREAKLSVVKMKFTPEESFGEVCSRINELITYERSGEKTYADKEVSLLLRLPRPLLGLAIAGVRWADYHGLLPKSFIDNDGFYCSVVIANLGSIGMRAGYHHLYEYGNCPIFMMVGEVEERPLVIDGELVVEKVLPIRWSYDERIDDGLTAKYGMKTVREALENPKQFGFDRDTVKSAEPVRDNHEHPESA